MTAQRTIRKVLIANRGEIAIRILRACSEMGIRSVAVFSDIDRGSMHVEFADEAYCIGEAIPARSYLNIAAILDVAKKSGADAIHPGYGFLAENAEFARAVADAGLIFIGPSPEVIDQMGEKVSARDMMKKFGVPTIPGTEESISSAEEAQSFAREFGYPVLLKAAAGGGGKGMRIVRRDEDIATAFRQATSEAQKSFGDPSVFLEKFVSPARHIEIQILGDSHGNYIHLGERECSVQRRFQKLVEETPSPFVDDALRRRMGEAAVNAARAMDYQNAGTFEFIVDPEKNFYFLEVNTRLQVEHPVTELVSGADLLKEQLRIAGGLPISQNLIDYSNNPRPHGHAIECRLTAENARADFAPSTGRITFLKVPDGPGVRVDRAVRAGSEVSVYYDSLLAKVIVWAANRENAIARMRRVLNELQVDGVDTSLEFHRWLMENEEFLGGRLSTKFVDEHYHPEDIKTNIDEELLAVAGALLFHNEKNGKNGKSTHSGPVDTKGLAWRMSGRGGVR
ncbi:acetyl-CoA carboxylase biotin carboxylase subunit [bacterium]|nr:acetyl-CoA carboxylase biotin carboxylase subunit [bacterium]